MDFTLQSAHDVRFEWGLPGAQDLAREAGVAILVDVLSFSTCVDIACSRGALVLPCPWQAAEAEAFARANGALLASRRGEGGPSLSPASLLTLDAGAKLVLPSPNGSRLSLACAARQVFAGCLRNASAIAAHAANQPGPIVVIACGERRPDGSLRPALEDLLGAGAIIAALPGSKSPEARLAAASFEALRRELAGLLAGCASGIELQQRGFADDVVLASALDSSRCVPVLVDGSYSAMPQPASCIPLGDS